MEYFAAGAGLLAGALDVQFRKRSKVSRWGMPVLLFLGLSVPYLKPFFHPLNTDELTD